MLSTNADNVFDRYRSGLFLNTSIPLINVLQLNSRIKILVITSISKMYHYFNIVSDRFTREIIHKLELSSRTRPSSRAYIAKIQIQRGIRICSFFLPAMIILLEHAIRLGDGAILCSRDTDQLSAEISIVPITLSRKSRNHVSPYFVACRTPRWIRASPRERTKFFLSTREKKKKKKNIAWSRKGLKTRQWIFCTTSKFVSMDGRRNRRKVFSIDG